MSGLKLVPRIPNGLRRGTAATPPQGDERDRPTDPHRLPSALDPSPQIEDRDDHESEDEDRRHRPAPGSRAVPQQSARAAPARPPARARTNAARRRAPSAACPNASEAPQTASTAT